MRRRVMLLSFAAGMLGIAGCGGGLKLGEFVKGDTVSREGHAPGAGLPPHAHGEGRDAARLADRDRRCRDRNSRQLHGVLALRSPPGFTKATFAHIHLGVPGKAGNIIVPLSDRTGAPSSRLRVGQSGADQGDRAQPRPLLRQHSQLQISRRGRTRPALTGKVCPDSKWHMPVAQRRPV